MNQSNPLIPIGRIEERILLIRGQRVMIDADLAEMYGTSTRVLNQAVKRNLERFPEDFMFQLTQAEKEEVITNCDHLNKLKFSPSLPFAFTEHGAIMAANVLNSRRAIAVSVFIVRAFVRLREELSTRKEMALKLAQLERKVADHDHTLLALVQALKKLAEPPKAKKLEIGFKPKRKSN